MSKEKKAKKELSPIERTRYRLRILLGVIIILALVYIVIEYAPDIIRLLMDGDEDAMEAYVAGAGAKGVFIIIMMQVLQTITIFFPGIPIYMCSGIIYGKLWGTIICYLTYVGSNVGIFIFSRRMKESADALLNNKDDSKLEELMQKTGHPAALVTTLCVVPIIPNGIIPHIAANSKLTLAQFFRSVAIGCIPGIFLFVCCGDLLLSKYFWLIIALMIVAVVGLILSVIFKEKFNAIIDKIMAKFAK